MLIKKGQLPIIVVNIIAVLFYTIVFISRKNYEFLAYVAVVLFFLGLILYTNQKINYPNELLWGLTIWSILHMSGGGLFISGARLYDLILLDIVGEPYLILKYDQIVHVFGFGVATFAMYYLIKPLLKQKVKRWISLSIVVVMAGLGLGALNEIIEFGTTVYLNSTGVGGYENTALDLVFNFIGAIIAMIVIWYREKVV